MFRVEVRGIGDTVKYFVGVRRRLKTEPNKMTASMGRKLKEKVGIEIDKLGHNKSGTMGHNTPTTLRSRLRFRKFTGGHKVFMDEKPEGKTENLPAVVEGGAPPHDIYNPKTGITVKHPGFTARKYWETGVGNWKSKDMNQEIRRRVEKIVGKK